jgi:hypothetical protein
MTTQSKTIYELMKEVRNHPDFMFGVIVTVDDLNGMQTTGSFDSDKAEECMWKAGSSYLDDHSRPGCECDTCTDSTCPEVIA